MIRLIEEAIRNMPNNTIKRSTLYSEVIVGDKEDLIAGSVDVIEVTSNGQKILHDFKT